MTNTNANAATDKKRQYFRTGDVVIEVNNGKLVNVYSSSPRMKCTIINHGSGPKSDFVFRKNNADGKIVVSRDTDRELSKLRSRVSTGELFPVD